MAIKDSSGRYDVIEQINGIYGWTVKDGKPVPPKYNFPDDMKKRINHFRNLMEDGLSFYGALRFILASNDNTEIIQECNFGGEWLPQTEETQNFLDNSWLTVTGTIAVALLYGSEELEEVRE